MWGRGLLVKGGCRSAMPAKACGARRHASVLLLCSPAAMQLTWWTAPTARDQHPRLCTSWAAGDEGRGAHGVPLLPQQHALQGGCCRAGSDAILAEVTVQQHAVQGECWVQPGSRCRLRRHRRLSHVLGQRKMHALAHQALQLAQAQLAALILMCCNPAHCWCEHTTCSAILPPDHGQAPGAAGGQAPGDQVCAGARREGALPHRRAGLDGDPALRELSASCLQIWHVAIAVNARSKAALRHGMHPAGAELGGPESYAAQRQGRLQSCHIFTALHARARSAAVPADRLKVWMLPTLAIIKQEKTTDYIVGLDELGGEDFATGGFAAA